MCSQIIDVLMCLCICICIHICTGPSAYVCICIPRTVKVTWTLGETRCEKEIEFKRKSDGSERLRD